MGVCCPFLRPWDRTRDQFPLNLPCLSDPVRRSSLLLKLALVALHLVFIGFLFVCDAEFIEKTKRDPWYMASYFLLFSATLLQYFVTSGSSPGYVIDAMRDVCETNAMYRNAPTTSIKSGSVIVTVEGESASGGRRTPSSWGKLVLDLYPPGTSLRNLTCGYCHVEQPPRAKHCHDCDRCVLQFDHHCVWLGTCVGQKNHCKFWWYICEETTLCMWTLIMYIDYLSNVVKPWWKNAIIILLLVVLVISLIFVLLLLLFHSYLILTNQSTYELVRRKRIPYMRYSTHLLSPSNDIKFFKEHREDKLWFVELLYGDPCFFVQVYICQMICLFVRVIVHVITLLFEVCRNIPERVHPFSKGIKRNLYNVCCSNDNLDSLPTSFELEDRSRPYTCLDMLKCRCC